jgi:hypothetical protein
MTAIRGSDAPHSDATRKRFASILRQRIVKPDAIKSTFLDFVQIYKQDKP